MRGPDIPGKPARGEVICPIGCREVPTSPTEVYLVMIVEAEGFPDLQEDRHLVATNSRAIKVSPSIFIGGSRPITPAREWSPVEFEILTSLESRQGERSEFFELRDSLPPDVRRHLAAPPQSPQTPDAGAPSDPRDPGGQTSRPPQPQTPEQSRKDPGF